MSPVCQILFLFKLIASIFTVCAITWLKKQRKPFNLEPFQNTNAMRKSMTLEPSKDLKKIYNKP